MFGEPGMASLLFKTMHQLFPRAEWDSTVPSPEKKNFADWWDNQFKLLPNDVRDRAEVYRNGIVESLIVIDKYPSWAIAEAQAGKMVQNFTELAKVGKSGSRSEWASFQNASASLLLRVSALFQAHKSDDILCDRIEARLRLGEETQRLNEVAGEPPDDVKIGKGVTAALYLKTITSPLKQDFIAKGYVDEILNSLNNLNSLTDRGQDPRTPRYLNELAKKVGNLRRDLITKYDDDLAVRSILIAEAMTPEYSIPSQSRPVVAVPPSKLDRMMQIKFTKNWKSARAMCKTASETKLRQKRKKRRKF